MKNSRGLQDICREMEEILQISGQNPGFFLAICIDLA